MIFTSRKPPVPPIPVMEFEYTPSFTGVFTLAKVLIKFPNGVQLILADGTSADIKERAWLIAYSLEQAGVLDRIPVQLL